MTTTGVVLLLTDIYLKAPVNLNLNVKNVGVLAFYDYCRYLWFKSLDQQGRITPSLMKSHRHSNKYWMTKLVSRGWAYKTDYGFQLKSYQYVWRTLGVKQVNKVKRYAFKYFTFRLKGSTPQEVYRHCVDRIRKELAENKRRQIISRLLTGKHKTNLRNKKLVKSRTFLIKSHEQPEFGSDAAANLFGYKSRTGGLTMLKKYFALNLNKPPILQKYYNCKGDLCYKLSSWTISL